MNEILKSSNKFSPLDYAGYSLRVDISHNEIGIATMHKYMTHFDVMWWYCSAEKGTVTGKPHYQCICFEKTPLTPKDLTLRRNWFRGKVVKKKGGGCSCALPKRTYRELFSYCTKEIYSIYDNPTGYCVTGNGLEVTNVVTNIEPRDIAKVKVWLNEDNTAFVKKKMLEKRLENYVNSSSNSVATQHNDWFSFFIAQYIVVYGCCPTSKSTFLKYAYKYKIIHDSDLLYALGINF